MVPCFPKCAGGSTGTGTGTGRGRKREALRNATSPAPSTRLTDRRDEGTDGTPASESGRMDRRAELFAQHHGLVRTRELRALGDDDEWIRMGRNYGRWIHIRQGWWALAGTPEVLLRAWRAGGRLACVSALAFHGIVLDVSDELHIEVPAVSKGARQPGLRVHWSRRQDNGDRRAVSVEIAMRQAARCGATPAPSR